MERLDKFLCEALGITRSAVKLLLKSGRVSVDGAPEKDGARKIDPDTQQICADGQACSERGRVVLMLHKPAGYLTATEDAHDATVMALLPQQYRALQLRPVGRLDKATEGLLLFTNDGELLHRLTSPKREIPKVYYARHEGTATEEDIAAFTQGLTLKDGTVCLSARLESLGAGESRITVREGKYHQVRRMMASRGMPVVYLKRLCEGELELGDLPLGQVRELTKEEVDQLLASVNLPI